MKTTMRATVLLICVALAACVARPRAVVIERSTDPVGSRNVARAPIRGQREYVVVRGDTLYGIAFRHGVDFRDLARWNRIGSPFTIYPGQRLQLSGSGAAGPDIARVPASPRAPAASVPAGAPSRSAVTTMPPPVTPVRTVPAPAPAATPTPSPPTATPPQPSRNAQGVTWRWPASGQLVSRYMAGDPTRQGVNIAGSSGQPIFAAADGEVVYSGAGLIGYGELVIVKHSDEFLSAYGHNRKRLVAEGQRVTGGQQIAEMGRSGAARDMLHFEIRRNGKPIDPLPLLPTR